MSVMDSVEPGAGLVLESVSLIRVILANAIEGKSSTAPKARMIFLNEFTNFSDGELVGVVRMSFYENASTALKNAFSLPSLTVKYR